MKNLLRFACILCASILAPSVLAITISHPRVASEPTLAQRARSDALALIASPVRATAAIGVPKANPVVTPLLSSLVSRRGSVGVTGILSGQNYAPATVISNPHVGVRRPTKIITPVNDNNPNSSVPLSVPDGSSTIGLLGMALLMTAVLKRRLVSEQTIFSTPSASLIAINQNQLAYKTSTQNHYPSNL